LSGLTSMVISLVTASRSSEWRLLPCRVSKADSDAACNMQHTAMRPCH
jgi:hypothetical protein